MVEDSVRPSVIHTTVHAWPNATLRQTPLVLWGVSLSALRVESSAVWPSLSLRFEEAMDRLGQLSQLYIEPDGSFVWVSANGASGGQIDGQLNDSSSGLISVELKITGPAADLSGILGALGWPEERVLFQLVQQGVYLAEPELRQLLSDLVS